MTKTNSKEIKKCNCKEQKIETQSSKISKTDTKLKTMLFDY